jgi:glycosyltransferase involved in cell wall biosynthesis
MFVVKNAPLIGWLRRWRTKPELPPTLPSGRPWPRISIVTPTYNQGKYIEETILSVANQNYYNVEHIVIDGASDDETPSILERYAQELAYCESRPDRGQSHALNKGFARATGEILTWLNSDDRLAPGALASVALAHDLTGADLFAGICELFGEAGTIVSHLTSCASAPLSLEDFLDEEFMGEGWSFYQPEVMFTRNLWERAGGCVDEGLHYVMDYDLWLRFAVAGARLQVIGRPIAQLRFHDQQKQTWPNDAAAAARHAAEVKAVRARYAGKSSYASHFPHRRKELPRKNRLVVQSADDTPLPYESRIALRRTMETLAYAGHDVVVSAPANDESQNEHASVEFSAMDAADVALVPDIPLLDDSRRHDRARSVVTPFLWAGLSSTELVVTNPAHVGAQPTVLEAPAGVPTHQFRPRDKAALRQRLGLCRRDRIIAVSPPSRPHADVAFNEIVKSVRALDRKRITVLAINCAKDVHFGLPNVVATGTICNENQLADWLAAADVYLAAAGSDAVRHYAVEAALCGVTAVGCRGSVVESAIINGVSGILVDPGDKDALERALSRLLDDVAYRDALGQWGRLAIEARQSYPASYYAIHRAFLHTGILQVWRDKISIRFGPAMSDTFTAASREAAATAHRPAVVNGRLLVPDVLPSFCIGLPVYNEAAVVESCIDRIAQFLKGVPARTTIIAVDDASRDDSYKVMLELSHRLPIIVHRHECHGGYGAANRTLCRLAAELGSEYVIVMNIDETQDPIFIASFFPLMRRGIDFIKATRYRLGGHVEGVPWVSFMISRVGNLLAQLFLRIPLSDSSNAFRAIRSDKWQQLKTSECGFELLIEECYCAKKLGLTIAEVPCVLEGRKESGPESKFSYHWNSYLNYIMFLRLQALVRTVFPKKRPRWIRRIGSLMSR